MSPTIRISQDTYDHLKEHAEPFVDTPDSVIRRLLGLDAQKPEHAQADIAPVHAEAPAASSVDGRGLHQEVAAKRAVKRRRPSSARATRSRRHRQTGQRAPRAPRGSLLAEEAYEVPILQVLADRGGRAGKNEVLDALEPLLVDRFTELDRTPITSGEMRWRNRAQFVRLRLVERGEIKRNSPRGIWELSDAGLARLQKVSQAAATERT